MAISGREGTRPRSFTRHAISRRARRGTTFNGPSRPASRCPRCSLLFLDDAGGHRRLYRPPLGEPFEFFSPSPCFMAYSSFAQSCLLLAALQATTPPLVLRLSASAIAIAIRNRNVTPCVQTVSSKTIVPLTQTTMLPFKRSLAGRVSSSRGAETRGAAWRGSSGGERASSRYVIQPMR